MQLSPDLAERYELLEALGEGAMGTVHLARDRRFERLVALKFPRFEGVADEERRRFVEEARVLARLRHPSIVGLLDFVERGEDSALVLEYVRGTTLEKMLADAPLPELERVLRWGGEILDALEHAHEAGVIHRDLKPSNVLVDEGDALRVTDFGLALRDDRSRQLTQAGTILGTPFYMAPELLRGEQPSPSSDVYAASCVLFELLAGSPPFRGKNVTAVLQAHLKGEHASLRAMRSDLPPELCRLVESGMERRKEDRPPSAGAMARSLRDLAAGREFRAGRTLRLDGDGIRTEGEAVRGEEEVARDPDRRSGKSSSTARAGRTTRKLVGGGGSLVFRRVKGGLLVLLLLAVAWAGTRWCFPTTDLLVEGSFELRAGKPILPGAVELHWEARRPGRVRYEIRRDGRSLRKGIVDGGSGPRTLLLRGLEPGALYRVRLQAEGPPAFREIRLPEVALIRPVLATSLWGRVHFDCAFQGCVAVEVFLEPDGGDAVRAKVPVTDFPIVLPRGRRMKPGGGSFLRWSISHGGKELASGTLNQELPVTLRVESKDPRYRGSASDREPRKPPIVVGARSICANRWGVVLAFEARRTLGSSRSSCPIRLAFAWPVLEQWDKGDGGGRVEALTALSGERVFLSKEPRTGPPIFWILSVKDRARRWRSWEEEPIRDGRDLLERRQRSLIPGAVFDRSGPWFATLSPGESRWVPQDLGNLFPRDRGRQDGDDLLLAVENRSARTFGMICLDPEKGLLRWKITLDRSEIEKVGCVGFGGRQEEENVRTADLDEDWSIVGSPRPVGAWVYQQLRIDRGRSRSSHEGVLLAFPRDGKGPGRVLFRHLRLEERSTMAEAADGRGVWVVAPLGILRGDADHPDEVEWIPKEEIHEDPRAYLHGASHSGEGRFFFSSWCPVGSSVERNFGDTVLGGRSAMRCLLLRSGAGGLRLGRWADPLATDFGVQRMNLRHQESQGSLYWGLTPHMVFALDVKTGACGVMDGTDVSSELKGAASPVPGEAHLFDSEGRVSLLALDLIIASGADRPAHLLPASHHLLGYEEREIRFRPLGWKPRFSYDARR